MHCAIDPVSMYDSDKNVPYMCYCSSVYIILQSLILIIHSINRIDRQNFHHPFFILTTKTFLFVYIYSKNMVVFSLLAGMTTRIICYRSLFGFIL